MNKLLLSAIFVLLSSCLLAQKMPKSREVVLDTEDGSLRVQIAIEIKPLRHANSQLMYYCLLKDSIHQIQGGYEGHLLHGRYTQLSNNRSPLVKGHFSNGLKHGEWKKWYPNGHLQQIERWRNGQLHGKYERFDGNGQLLASGQHRKGQLHGKNRLYEKGELLEVNRYRKGAVKPSKEARRLKRAKKKEEKAKAKATPPSKEPNKQ